MNQDQEKKAVLKEEYYFECKCLLCSNEYWSILALGINCKMDPLYNDAIAPSFMTMKELRELPQVEKYERAAIEFLEKFDNIHPVYDTVFVQSILHTTWMLLASRFDFIPPHLSNADYLTKFDGEILFPLENIN